MRGRKGESEQGGNGEAAIQSAFEVIGGETKSRSPCGIARATKARLPGVGRENDGRSCRRLLRPRSAEARRFLPGLRDTDGWP